MTRRKKEALSIYVEASARPRRNNRRRAQSRGRDAARKWSAGNLMRSDRWHQCRREEGRLADARRSASKALGASNEALKPPMLLYGNQPSR